ncbi:MAG: hypothetical protein FJ265_09790 [Planctomycetes bacterium]|nr:hypothetical protein [Planctomycetota bacterium]
MRSLRLLPDRRAAPAAADYARDRADLVAALRACGAVAVYEIGSIGTPGISDLDLLACFPDGRGPGGFAPLEALLAQQRPSLLHPPWGMLARHRDSLPALFAFRQIRDVDSGATIPAVQTPLQRRLWNVEAVAATGGLLLQRRNRSTARSALCLLNGITYNLQLAAEDGIGAPGGESFAEAIRDLRRRWFEAADGDRRRELARLWAGAPAVLHHLLGGYATAFAHELPRGHGDVLLERPGTRVSYCFSDRGARGLLPRPFATVQVLPRGLAPLFELLASPGTGLDRWLRPVQQLPTSAPPAPDAAFAAGVRGYARANAAYLRDMLALRSPLLLLNAGTLVHLGAPRRGLFAALAHLPGRLLRLGRN